MRPQGVYVSVSVCVIPEDIVGCGNSRYKGKAGVQPHGDVAQAEINVGMVPILPSTCRSEVLSSSVSGWQPLL